MTLSKEIIQQIKADKGLSPSYTYWGTNSCFRGEFKQVENVNPKILEALQQLKVNKLYSHQVEAINEVNDGKNVILVTGTSSGKSLCYQVPILEKYLNTGLSTALLLFPTKALTYDQLYAFNYIQNLVVDREIAAVYDGDTPASIRQSIRKNSKVILTNPDMLNVALLPFHTNWATFFQNLNFIVIDELHQYRGIFGSHFSNLIRRLKRVLEFYGSKPQFIMTSATIGNPKELAELLLEEPVEVIEKDDSPKGERNTVFYNPPLIHPDLGIREGLLTSAVKIGSYLIAKDIQTIVFCRSRRFVELVVRGLRENFHGFESKIRGYRSGYLKSERREIESGLKNRSILLVAATNALELGVDIGGVDAVVIAGYPGSTASIKQMSGRAGRHQSDSISIILASMNPLDQYFARFPETLFSRPIEQAYIDPDNPLILLPHLKASAYEYPFTTSSTFGNIQKDELGIFLDYLVEQNDLQKKGDKYFWMSEVFPAREFSIRSTSASNLVLQVENDDEAHTVGEVDFNSGLWMVHPGAVYLHDGTEYLVKSLDLEKKIAFMIPYQGTYRTEPINTEEISIDEIKKVEPLEYCELKYGTLDIVSQVNGFKKIDSYTNEVLGVESLTLPQTNLNTNGFWVVLKSNLIEKLNDQNKWLAQKNDYGPEWNHLRDLVLSRDHNTCQSCGKKGGILPLQIHHKIPFKSFTSIKAANSIDNLVSLCADCHRLAEMNVKIRSCLAGLRYVFANLAPLLVLCDPRDIDSVSDPYSKFEGLSPVVLIHDTVPGGIGLSDSLFSQFSTLIQKSFELVSTCPCESGCPSCVGPEAENGIGGKPETLYLLSLLKEQYD
jgi:DEAD/DEAH box helicase domain-containing protein